jgi:hypothetical protein
MVRISVSADDVLIISKSMKAFEETLQKLQDAAQVRLIINQEKTKLMRVSN